LIIIIIVILIIILVPTIYFIVKKFHKTTSHPPHTPSCPAFATIPNTNIIGFNINKVGMVQPQPSLTEAQCQTQCQTNKCDWYNFDLNGNCWLKQGIPNSNMTIGFKVPNPSPGCANYTRIVGKDITGYDIPQLNGLNGYPSNTETDCQHLCNTNPSCMMYGYDQNKKICHLKQAISAPNIDTGFAINPLPQ
jgi:hypothetical protein